MKPIESRLSRRFWIWGFVFMFLLHAFAIFLLADRRVTQHTWQKPSAFIYFSSDPASDRRLAEASLLQDPTMFALPHPRGFSGGAWLNFRPALPKLTNWSAPPEWLAFSADYVGHSLNDYIATNRPPEEQLLAALRAGRSFEIRIPDQAVLTGTVMKIEGALAGRKLSATPSLPGIPHPALLRRTVVAVVVNGEGVVESAVVVGESESKAADDQAVELARAFVFEPLPIREARTRSTAPPTLGQLTFTWHVTMPTNLSPVTASTP
jgi:TonB family protein